MVSFGRATALGLVTPPAIILGILLLLLGLSVLALVIFALCSPCICLFLAFADKDKFKFGKSKDDVEASDNATTSETLPEKHAPPPHTLPGNYVIQKTPSGKGMTLKAQAPDPQKNVNVVIRFEKS